MRVTRGVRRACPGIVLGCLLVLGLVGYVEAQDAAESQFSPEQLEQIVAPVALYPDNLLTQILMAATYPLELVEAERWLASNSTVTGAALDEALKGEDWDASVKSLCHVPDVLKKMSENLDWTQDLGDAFLAQKTELMDTVQRMRGKAKDAGNLESSQQLVVTQQPDRIIVIESPSPEVVYVPTYSPTVVYGSAWSYPTYYYPPMYAPPPPGYGLMAFGVGMAVGAAVWGNANWGWGHSDVDIDINRYNEFNRNTNINPERTRIDQTGAGGRSNWQHDPAHRKGVNYANQDVGRKYGAREGTSRVSRDQARGRSGERAAASTGARAPGAGVSDRSPAGSRTGPSAGQVDRGAGAGAGSRDTARSAGAGAGSRDSAMSGSRNAGFDRAASSRGSMSRSTTSFGGGARGAGGGGGRGGRR